MRGMPKIATKDDVLHVARDCPPEVARQALWGLSAKFLEEIGLTMEEFSKLKRSIGRALAWRTIQRKKIYAIRLEFNQTAAELYNLRLQIQEQSAVMKALWSRLHELEARKKHLGNLLSGKE